MTDNEKALVTRLKEQAPWLFTGDPAPDDASDELKKLRPMLVAGQVNMFSFWGDGNLLASIKQGKLVIEDVSDRQSVDNLGTVSVS